MLKQLKYYELINKPVRRAIFAQLFLQLVNSSFMLSLVQYMNKFGYEDHEAAEYISYRFLGVLLLSFPLGMLIKGRKLKPLFIIGSYCVPALGLLILYATEIKADWLIELSSILWGVCFTCFQVTMLPFIIRNASVQYQSEAISLSYATYSFSLIFSGGLIFFLKNLGGIDYGIILRFICCISIISVPLVHSIKLKEAVPKIETKRTDLGDFDWGTILKAAIPTLIIATGAGLTIPFMGIFFLKVHNLDIDKFSVLGIPAAILVVTFVMLVPTLKRKFGYKLAITASQSIAVVALILLAVTDWISELEIAIYIAIACFVIRQPLMNMAAPMTSELVMNYVGKRNQEMISAVTAAIWSGTWYFSSRIFKILRESDLRYGYVLLITASLYIVGIVLYYFLIVDYDRKVKSGKIIIEEE